jgi:hypothetical protein
LTWSTLSIHNPKLRETLLTILKFKRFRRIIVQNFSALIEESTHPTPLRSATNLSCAREEGRDAPNSIHLLADSIGVCVLELVELCGTLDLEEDL